jgi:hypothetical protein
MSSIVPRSFPKTEAPIEAVVADLVPYKIELHLNTDVALAKKYGKAIRATAGGTYTDVRGHHNHRFVTLLSTQRELIEKLMREFGFAFGSRANDKLTMIVRFDGYAPNERRQNGRWRVRSTSSTDALREAWTAAGGTDSARDKTS